eukprot:Anaeramoba_ignava/a478356_75.p3 GENE.a478356_75~~a478356_75.p3  ORF type:complete len:190 (+),score=44.78 a478356_75:3985-4554(+)
MIWDFDKTTYKVSKIPRNVLYGHDDEVTCIDMRIDLDIIVSGSKDGTCIIHTLQKAKYIRSIIEPNSSPVKLLKILPNSHIVIYSEQSKKLSLFTINAKMLNSKKLSDNINCLSCSQDGNFLIVGTQKGFIRMIRTYNFSTVKYIELHSPITSLYFLEFERLIFVGLENGNLAILHLHLLLSCDKEEKK